jgi:hypothetical protein
MWERPDGLAAQPSTGLAIIVIIDAELEPRRFEKNEAQVWASSHLPGMTPAIL